MQHRTKRSRELFNLIRNFEKRIQAGTLIYLDEKETFQLLEYYEQENMLDRAVNVVDLAITQNPYRSEFYLLKTRLLCRMQAYENALDTIQYALNYSPMEYDLLYLKVRILTELRNFTDALEIISGLRMRAHARQKTQVLLFEAHIYELQRQYFKMYSLIKEALIHAPSSRMALKRMWVAVEITKNYEESVELHSGIIDLQPYNYLAWFNLGHAYACLGRYQESINALEYSFLIEPEFEAAYSDCADMCVQLKRYNQALEIQVGKLEKFGLESPLLVEIAESLIALKRSDEAFSYLDKANKLDPYNDEVYYNFARAYAMKKNWNAVIDNLTQALQIEKRREEYYNLIAQAYSHIEDYSKADYFHRKATETGPENPFYWYDHIEFLFNINAYRAALEVVREALLHTYSTSLDCAKVAALYMSGQRKKAINELETLAKEESFDINSIYQLTAEIKNDKKVQSILQYYQNT